MTPRGSQAAPLSERLPVIFMSPCAMEKQPVRPCYCLSKLDSWKANICRRGHLVSTDGWVHLSLQSSWQEMEEHLGSILLGGNSFPELQKLFKRCTFCSELTWCVYSGSFLSRLSVLLKAVPDRPHLQMLCSLSRSSHVLHNTRDSYSLTNVLVSSAIPGEQVQGVEREP